MCCHLRKSLSIKMPTKSVANLSKFLIIKTLTSGNGIDDMCSTLNRYLIIISRFFFARALSPPKLTATTFSKNSKEYRLDLDITVDGLKFRLSTTLLCFKRYISAPSLHRRPPLLPKYKVATKLSSQ